MTTRRQILAHWEASKGFCWRCEQPIVNEVYGVGWQLGHCKKPRWMGGVEIAPEHTECNKADGIVQTKIAAKSVRIRARAAGIKKPSRLAEKWAWFKKVRAGQKWRFKRNFGRRDR